jgi:hypothetical protein
MIDTERVAEAVDVVELGDAAAREGFAVFRFFRCAI